MTLANRLLLAACGQVVASVLALSLVRAQADDDSPLLHPTRTDASEWVGGVPLGGIGAGTVELRGDGSFREWQIFNNWGNTPSVALFKNPPSFDLLNAFAAVRVNDKACVLETHPAGGLPGVASIHYDGWFPFANLEYVLGENARNPPLDVSLEGFGAYCPHHSADSGLPAIGLTYGFKNNSAQPVKISLALSLVNPLGTDCDENSSGALPVAESVQGNSGMGVAALDASAVSFLGGPDNAETLKSFWSDFSAGSLNLTAPAAGQRFGQVVTFTLQPGQEKAERFVVGWFFPDHRENGKGPLVGHQYEAWADSAAAAVNLFAHRFEELHRAGTQWCDTMKDTTWPDWIARWLCNSQSTIVKCTWWVKDGRFMNYESFACPNSSPVHIIDLADWPVLDAFPDLELALLRHYAEKQEASGKIPEEFAGPDTTPSVTYPGGRDLLDVNPKYVLEIFHRWRETGDRQFLDAVWPTVPKAILYNDRRFDGLKIGVPSGKNIISTWDHWSDEYGMSYGGSVWMAGLRAAEELARVEGDDDFAGQAHDLYTKALATMNDHFWTGEFYTMTIDQNLQPNHLSFVESTYGDAAARFMGLGPILPDDRSLATLRAIAKYNTQPTAYGVVIAADTTGKMVEYAGDRRSQITTCHSIPAPVALIQQGDAADQQAGLKILQGVYAIAEKHPGGLWNMPHHVVAETGERNVDDFAHYLRDRCIWALLKVLNGWDYDAVNQTLAVGPVLTPEKSRGPWICPTGYGTLAQDIVGKLQNITLWAREGTLTLAELDVRSRVGRVVGGGVNERNSMVPAGVTQVNGVLKIKFNAPLALGAGDKVVVTLIGLGDH